jgi:hypothetical protein
MSLSIEEIKTKIESSFSPYKCVAEIWDYKRQIKFLITDKDSNEIHEQDSWNLSNLSKPDHLEAGIVAVKDLVQEKGFNLD